jgi:hypothetical protein
MFMIDSVTKLSPNRNCEIGGNTIKQNRLIEHSISALTDPYHVKVDSKRNRLPGCLPIDAVKKKKILGGVFGKMKRQVSKADVLPNVAVNDYGSSVKTVNDYGQFGKTQVAESSEKSTARHKIGLVVQHVEDGQHLKELVMKQQSGVDLPTNRSA